MTEPTENQQTGMSQLTEAIKLQTVALTRLAESNESRVAVILQLIDDRDDDEEPEVAKTYLSGKPRG